MPWANIALQRALLAQYSCMNSGETTVHCYGFNTICAVCLKDKECEDSNDLFCLDHLDSFT